MRTRLAAGGSASAAYRTPGGVSPESVPDSGPEPESPLFEARHRIGTTGAGVELLQSMTAPIAVETHESSVGFPNEHTVNKTQSRKKIENASNLVYRDKMSGEI
eukprot:641130-Pyramimonas_sp.AAC.1